MIFSRSLIVSSLAAFALGAVPLLGADDNHPAEAGKPHAAGADAPKDSHHEAAAPSLSVTEHSVVIAGKPVKYKVTAGYLILKEENEKPPGKGEEKPGEAAGDAAGKDSLKPKARIFFVAYTVEGADAGN